ncbi:SDR family NAD(P)-dependent oxidoreductase [Patescibacteria group bacterium]|nr:SDR family NAD(P)-dependent oxidoreductase [Patescibacteria group bacterium]
MKYLVTGGAGFIGSNLVRRLVKDGAQVTVLDNLATGDKHNLDEVARDITFINGDIRDGAAVQKACQGIDVVWHQAALRAVPRSIEEPLLVHEVNATGTLIVLKEARDAGVSRVVYASSSSVYGDTGSARQQEDLATRPMSPYAVSKLAGENYCRAFASVYGLTTVALRYFNVFGPGQDPTSQYSAVIPKFITALLRGESPTIFGDGEQSRDFTYIDISSIDNGSHSIVEPNRIAGRDYGACHLFKRNAGTSFTALLLYQYKGRFDRDLELFAQGT